MKRRVSPRISAGLVLYRIRQGQPEVLLAYPGGKGVKLENELFID